WSGGTPAHPVSSAFPVQALLSSQRIFSDSRTRLISIFSRSGAISPRQPVDGRNANLLCQLRPVALRTLMFLATQDERPPRAARPEMHTMIKKKFIASVGALLASAGLSVAQAPELPMPSDVAQAAPAQPELIPPPAGAAPAPAAQPP